MPRKNNLCDDQFIQEYSKKVLKRISNYLEKNDLSQKEFSRKCGISQSTLSKILDQKSSLTLPVIARMCEVMDIDPSCLLSSNDSILDNLDTFDRRIRASYSYHNNDSLIFDSYHSAFKGILGEYHFYCRPTISSESGFLKGFLKLSHSNTEDNYCKAKLDLLTGKCNPQGEEIIKTYNGQMIISLPLSSCYTILSSDTYSEYSFLNWHHFFLNDQELECRLVAILTTSAGSNRRPVMEKAIISREELSPDDLDYLSGQFNMNSASIEIEQERFVAFVQPELTEKELQSIDYMKNQKKIYTWDEGVIRGAEFTSQRKLEIINLLRKHSMSQKYVKVSNKGDELLFSYIQNKKQKYYQSIESKVKK